MNAQVLAKREVFIGDALSKFAAGGSCTDELTRKFVTDQLTAFERWIAGVQRMAGS